MPGNHSSQTGSKTESTSSAQSKSADSSTDAVRRREYSVTSDPDYSIFVREMRSTGMQEFRTPPILLIHGARVPSIASFDLDVSNGSLAADLARSGYPVHLMDARGYGRSTRPPEMSRSPDANPPLVRSSAVVEDIAAVVTSIRQRLDVSRIALLGWATGGQWAGYYASLYPERVSHLIYYNSIYGDVSDHPNFGIGSNLADPNNPEEFAPDRGAYRYNTAQELLPSWNESIPVEDKSKWRDPAVVNAYQQTALASDSTSDTRSPPSFRAPNGALEDSFYLATGRQLYDGSLIRSPTLFLRSEFDFWSRPEDPQRLQDHADHAPEFRFVQIPQATHYVHLDRSEHGRTRFIEEVLSFLAECSD